MGMRGALRGPALMATGTRFTPYMISGLIGYYDAADLQGMSQIAASISIVSVADNGGGKPRFLVASTASMATNDVVVISGSTTYDGSWTITVFDGTHFDVLALSFGATSTGTVTAPVTADSQSVGFWTDRSGTGVHLSVATAAKRPLYKANGISAGKPSVLPDGSDDTIRHGTGTNISDFTVIYGGTVSSFAASRPIIGGQNGAPYCDFASRRARCA